MDDPLKANLNMCWADGLVRTAVACGVKHAIVSPGSRSGPLAVAIALNGDIISDVVLDERSAAFIALGIAKRTGTPTLLLCSSGTAGANYYPAIIEAREAGVPLLVLTADRPHELRNCHSGQTITQLKIFASYPVFQDELPLPENSEEHFLTAKDLMIKSVKSSIQKRGPVHLNAPFRDPLAPISDPDGFTPDFSPESSFNQQFALKTQVPDLNFFTRQGKMLILVGSREIFNNLNTVDNLTVISQKLSAPIFDNGLTGVRFSTTENIHPVFHYDVVLRNDALAEKLKPDQVICIGQLPVSKTLRKRLSEWNTPIYFVESNEDDYNAVKVESCEHWCGALADFVDALPTLQDTNYAEKWMQMDRKAERLIGDELSKVSPAFEGLLAWHLNHVLCPHTRLFVGNSTPIRDIEYFLRGSNLDVVTHSNRGANGIDGTLSTALGIAHHGNEPVYAIVGDLSLLHDSNAWLFAKDFKGSLTVVIINNNGGGIFHHLPISQYEPPFEQFFGTPQSVTPKALAAMHGIKFKSYSRCDALLEELHEHPASGIRWLEYCTNREEDAKTRIQLLNTVSKQLEL